MQLVDGFPRRARIDLNTPTERAIRRAIDAVESLGAHTLLTDAVVLLGQARDKVADYVELPANAPCGATAHTETTATTKPLFWQMVASELVEARDKHKAALNSAHEAWAVILEELEEFKTQVFKRRENRDKQNMLRELIQTAAMCQRAAEDIGLIS